MRLSKCRRGVDNIISLGSVKMPFYYSTQHRKNGQEIFNLLVSIVICHLRHKGIDLICGIGAYTAVGSHTDQIVICICHCRLNDLYFFCCHTTASFPFAVYILLFYVLDRKGANFLTPFQSAIALQFISFAFFLFNLSACSGVKTFSRSILRTQDNDSR